MRKWLMLGVGAAWLGAAGLAAAQPAPSTAPPPAPPAAEAGRPGPGERPDGPPHGAGPRDGMRGMHGMMHGRHRPPAPPLGSSFTFRRGDTEVRVRCSDKEPVQACVNAANALFDKFNATPR
ncbi:hypothetical protein [Teichococcus oryzae]|uniref:Uncharacterized protein n=1 Tax=Teichococcus oryzae TaxID=1608942 RepID=A0A5B2TIX9_9PROT|nr:hypothetical protein [Pseudoroseomonas oryzae]KAA2213750.1 hypothetical protein F0Q34_06690 [Pseudoroseomonas oryzae]